MDPSAKSPPAKLDAASEQPSSPSPLSIVVTIRRYSVQAMGRKAGSQVALALKQAQALAGGSSVTFLQLCTYGISVVVG